MAGHLHVVGHQNDGVALSVEFLENGHHLFAALAVEGPGRFVRQDHLAAVGQRPGDTDPLLLATGELARGVMAAIAQPQPGEQCLGAGLALGPRRAGVDGRDLHVGGGIEVRQQVVALKDEAEVVAAQPGEGEGIQGVAVSWPRNRYWPLLGRSRQPSRFIRVDLPEPEAPTMAIISPASMVRSSGWSTVTSCSPLW